MLSSGVLNKPMFCRGRSVKGCFRSAARAGERPTPFITPRSRIEDSVSQKLEILWMKSEWQRDRWGCGGRSSAEGLCGAGDLIGSHGGCLLLLIRGTTEWTVSPHWGAVMRGAPWQQLVWFLCFPLVRKTWTWRHGHSNVKRHVWAVGF